MKVYLIVGCLCLYGIIHCAAATVQHQGSPLNTTDVDRLNQHAKKFYHLDSDSTKILADSALQLSLKLSYSKGQADAYHCLGVFHINRDQLDSALFFSEKALQLKREMDDTKSISSTLNNIGVIQTRKGNHTKALHYYQESLKYKIEAKDTVGIASAYNNLAVIHYEQEDYEQAIDYYQRSLKINEKLSNLVVKANSFGGIGMIYMDQERYDLALFYFEKANKLNDSLNLECRRAYTASFLGVAYIKTGAEEKALSLLNLAYQDAMSCKIRSVLSYSLYGLATIHFHEGKVVLAEREYLESYKIAEEFQLKKEILNTARALYEFYKDQGQAADALHYLEIAEDVEDEMFNEKQTEQLTRIELNYAFEQERDSLAFQKKAELMLLNSEFDKQMRWQYITIAGLIVAVVFGLIVYCSYRSNYRARLKLQEKNRIISATLSEREVLLREIHHRVKNNLQVVSSLLNIQSKFLKDELAIRAVQEGRNRVLSMALVHEKLYQSEDLSNINVKEYLEQLTETLFQSYNISDERVRLTSDIGKINLPIDTTIQVGLIINELVSNALKHAFPEGKNGLVALSLHQTENKVALEVSDNGIGISSTDELTRSYGYRMIQSIARGLDGSLSIDLDQGTRFRLDF